MGTGELQMKTIVIGDLMLDKYVFGIVERVSPESGCPILKQTTCEYQLGGAANVAKQLKHYCPRNSFNISKSNKLIVIPQN